MEEVVAYLFMVILVIALIAYLIYLLFKFVVIPFFILVLIASVAFAFYISIKSFVLSLQKHLNPYITYVDKSKYAEDGIKRNYFFGPGYHQISITVKDSFINQNTSITDFKTKIDNWREKLLDRFGNQWYIAMWIHGLYYFTYICAYVSSYVFGSIWTVIFSTLMAVVLFLAMCGFYLYFSVLWIGDRAILTFKSIQSRCPNCKKLSVVPTFACSSCGKTHQNLTPGPYGVMKRKCTCGNELPTTIFTGRSKLEAYCPACGTNLYSSDSQQYGIQLVGSTSTGKTTFMVAFWHEYLEKVSKISGLILEKNPLEEFEILENFFQDGEIMATTEMNARMYSLVHKIGDKTSIQMTIYDVAGEFFNSDYDTQEQFRYSEGIILVIDPTADKEQMRDAITIFINNFKTVKKLSTAKLAKVPVAVIISKADLYKKYIGPIKIKALMKKESEKYLNKAGVSDYATVRNQICHDFLEGNDYLEILGVINSNFSLVQYFPVSAMGHPIEDRETYEPWGVLEPVYWLISQYDTKLKDIIFEES